MEIQHVQCLKVNCPELFRDNSFVAWLRSGIPIATWDGATEQVGEYADTFVTYDHGEGSDFEEMPGHIRDKLRQVAEENGMTHGVLWLTNCAE